MKVIANRFKVIFPNYITPKQAGFIDGRNISDNIIIAQEVIHSMQSRKTCRNWMAIKLDLEKAYDRISWELIDVSLVAVGVPRFLRKVIMGAISSSTMQMLWNRVPYQSFKPMRGIRQGCPLSPYIFVFCMEWLGYLICFEIIARRWKPIQLSRSGLNLSHLFFADDLVIFCKVEMDQALLLKEILKRFCDFSGHKISARRVTLAQSVLLAIPNYFMQSLLVPKGVCDEIEKIVRQFIWGSSIGHHKMALRSNCSHLWRSLSKVWPLFCENIIWSIGDGTTIRGWKDLWVPDVSPLYSYAEAHSRLNLESPLRDWILPNGSWNVEMLSV
ncbi:hypothetical protein J1N35_030062 [Gossypium stocksii]|uniref:Reverse transcriptase domain-containing protein n=1 Tax=Gossypium stocksii TaxID=47602 RepID=A0A9D3UZD0_9ROSI|nr:hypothetical protein J1N35_030062 [Gossypium stocksii]